MATKSNVEFTCSMDGYVEMTLKIINLSLVALAIVKETYAAILPNDLGKSIQYAWDGLTGAGSWAGYAVAAVYFFGLDYGYADIMCTLSEYGYKVIDAISIFTEFAS